MKALPIPPRGLNRVQAATYIGVSPTTFDGLIKAGLMPKPKRIKTRTVWDVRAVDVAFDALPGDDGGDANPWD